MNELKNWKEVTKGLYRYVISANVAYEIHIIHWDHKTDILSANASLFIVGDWINHVGKYFTERECLLENTSLAECITKAIEDDKENNNN